MVYDMKTKSVVRNYGKFFVVFVYAVLFFLLTLYPISHE